MLDVVFDLFAPTNTPETRNQANGVIGLDHSFPLRIQIMPEWQWSAAIASAWPGRARRMIGAGLSGNARQAHERHGQFLLVVVPVDEFALVVVDVGLHIEMAVAGKVEQDRLFLAFLLAAQRLVDGATHRVIGLRRRHDAFAACELDASLEARLLMVG